jgi:hypothetical protein
VTSRRTNRAAVLALTAVLAAAGWAGTAGAIGAPVVDLDHRVEYPVNTPEYPVVMVDGPHVRNGSCSVSRGFRNVTDVPLLVTARATWDGQETEPVFPQLGDSQYTAPTWLAPGERAFAVWTNHDFIPNTAVQLLITAQVAVGDIGVNKVEFIPACQPDEPPVDTTVPTVETTVPTTAPVPVPETTSPSEPAPPLVEVEVFAPAVPEAETGVLEGTVARTLPATGVDTGTLVLAVIVLLLAGGVLILAAHGLKESER